MQRLLLLGLAGILGTLARYWLSGLVARRFGETFPTGTLVVNLLGCLLIGVLFYLFEERTLFSPVLRTAILLGFLGSFTTFSSFGLQTFLLLRDGEYLLGAVYTLLSNLLGVLFVWLGYSFCRNLTEAPW